MTSDFSKIDPKLWGPPTWRIMFIFAVSYPVENPSEESRRGYRNFYLALAAVLPCPTCRNHFEGYTKANPIDCYLNSSFDLLNWLVLVYNQKRPPETRLKTLKDVAKLIKPDVSCKALLSQIKEVHGGRQFVLAETAAEETTTVRARATAEHHSHSGRKHRHGHGHKSYHSHKHKRH